MTPTIAGRLLAALLAAVLVVPACSDSGSDDADDTATSTTADGEAPTDTTGDTTGTDGEATASTDTTATPDDDAVSARNGDVVCDVLSAEAVGDAIGVEVTGSDGYGLGTPQCSYTFDDGETLTTVSVAAQRSDEDLDGLTGDDAFDFAVDVNLSLGDDIESEDVSIDGADAAAVIEGSALSGLVLLVGDDIYTVFSPALDRDQLEALGAVVVTAVA